MGILNCAGINGRGKGALAGKIAEQKLGGDPWYGERTFGQIAKNATLRFYTGKKKPH